MENSTNQFLAGIEKSSNEFNLTQKLFRNQQLTLTEPQLKSLTDAWGNVVSSFVKGAQNTDTENLFSIGNPMTIASFFYIQNCLETLYSRLSTNVSLIN